MLCALIRQYNRSIILRIENGFISNETIEQVSCHLNERWALGGMHNQTHSDLPMPTLNAHPRSRRNAVF